MTVTPVPESSFISQSFAGASSNAMVLPISSCGFEFAGADHLQHFRITVTVLRNIYSPPDSINGRSIADHASETMR